MTDMLDKDLKMLEKKKGKLFDLKGEKLVPNTVMKKEF